MTTIINFSINKNQIKTNNLTKFQKQAFNKAETFAYFGGQMLIGYIGRQAIFEEYVKFGRKYFTFSRPNFSYVK